MQVEWNPWASFDHRFGFDVARRISQVRRLYSFIFFLGERVISQHSSLNQLLAPAFPLSTMRRPATTPITDREALEEGIRYHFFVIDMPYQAFVTTYLLGEAPGTTPQVIYDRYVAL